jgi:hypothetical protein
MLNIKLKKSELKFLINFIKKGRVLNDKQRKYKTYFEQKQNQTLTEKDVVHSED